MAQNINITVSGVQPSPVTVTISRAAYTGGSGLPSGGTTGQVLAKTSNANGDTEWVDAASGGGQFTSDELIKIRAIIDIYYNQ